jgi:hypothetical protein
LILSIVVVQKYVILFGPLKSKFNQFPDGNDSNKPLPLVLVKNETSPRGVLGYVVKPLALYC